MVAQLLLALSILVGVHEWGHMFTAKLFGMRVEKFSIGFPPKVFGFKKGETEYMLGAVPLGGFVKISGMVDESLDMAQISAPPQPWEFRAKPAWQRLIVMLGGIIVNVITGIFIFILLTYFLGERYTPIAKVNQYGIRTTELGREIGLQENDKIVAMNGTTLQRFEDTYNPRYFLQSGSFYTVERQGQPVRVDLPPDLLDQLSDKKVRLASPQLEKYPLVIEEVSGGSPAEKAGLQAGDLVAAVNGAPVALVDAFRANIESNKGKQVALQINRKGTPQTVSVKVSDEGRIGIVIENDLYAKESFTFWQSIPKGAQSAFEVLGVQAQAFGKMFRGELSVRKSLGGPVAIAQQFGGRWDWLRFWTLTGLLSMVLAFMNLLPIPALDGGHVVFLSYEIISGRKPSDRFLENAQKVGMVLLLALMVFVFGNDIYNLVVKNFG
jgi:regulator of sigma E protease